MAGLACEEGGCSKWLLSPLDSSISDSRAVLETGRKGAHCVWASSRHASSRGCSRLLRDWCWGCSGSGLCTKEPPGQVQGELLGRQHGAGVGRVAGSNQLLVKASTLQGQAEGHSRMGKDRVSVHITEMPGSVGQGQKGLVTLFNCKVYDSCHRVQR
jgi:hypothetical protein